MIAPLEELRAEARYRRERYDLYRAKTYAGRPTTAVRLRELQRECEGAEGRLKAAEIRASRSGSDGTRTRDLRRDRPAL